MTIVMFKYISPQIIRISGDCLLLPCEVGVKTILPAVKAIMARNIVEKHGFKERETADLLGLSQSAISRYLNRGRGNLIEIEGSIEVQTLIDQMVTILVKEPQNKSGIMDLFCQTCTTIRHQGLMCSLCQKEMPQSWADACSFCREI
jgi:predicted transcriptional regulator